jgi:hypothetical protein
MISCDQVVGTLLFHVFQSFTEKIHTVDEVDKISKGVDRLTNKAFHIGELAKNVFNSGFCIKTVPNVCIIKEIIEHNNKRSENASSNKRYQHFFTKGFPKQLTEKNKMSAQLKLPMHYLYLSLGCSLQKYFTLKSNKRIAICSKINVIQF